MTEQEIKDIIVAKQARRAEQYDPEKNRKRALEMANLYAGGTSLSEIGQTYNVSRQRAHQIIKAFIKG